MPELPEVETYTRYFTRHALEQKIARVEVRDERILGEIRKETFVKKLRGGAFKSARRHGKHLFAEVGGKATWLHLHFGMSGDLAYSADREGEPRFARVVFHFDNGEWLAFEDMRLFGVVELVQSPDEYIAEHKLGPDPLDPKFTFARFASLLERRRGAIKSLLMTQEILAGLGNLYVDETLYQTAIHPRRTVDELSKAEENAIFTTMRRMLRDVITRHERGAALPSQYLYHHREEGERCPKCGGTIQRAVVFGRTTYFCGKHQR
ncbi:MAG TPA: DNA-formamidopyrimidine glycosylase family protein [Thermoanaerobaculia bacterium]|nr:DNA-formamidopyrimidine glycosylase family protein [Thermoanaerobaculia bacterium]